jgi:hypothetical protein
MYLVRLGLVRPAHMLKFPITGVMRGWRIVGEDVQGFGQV